MRPPSPKAFAWQLEQIRGRETGVRLSRHARERMTEMGATRDQIERIVLEAQVDRPTKKWHRGELNDRCRMAVHDDYPGWAVVYAPIDGVREVVTVLFRSYETYDRAGDRAIVKPAAGPGEPPRTSGPAASPDAV